MKGGLIVIGILWMSAVNAQSSGSSGITVSLPPVAKTDIEPSGTTLNFNLVAPAEAGNAVTAPAAISSLWLNLTSAVAPLQTRSMTVSMAGSLLPGISLKVQVAAATSSGAGVKGTPASQVTLNASEQPVITGIGGAYTGNGVGSGFNLTYSVSLDNYSALRSGSSTVTIVYTLADN